MRRSKRIKKTTQGPGFINLDSDNEDEEDSQQSAQDSQGNVHDSHDTNQFLDDQESQNDSAGNYKGEKLSGGQSQNEASEEDDGQFEGQNDSIRNTEENNDDDDVKD